MSVQQDQTQQYFNVAAADWQNKASGASNAYNVIDGRRRAVLDVVGQAPAPGRFLDVGCGSGQLAIDVARLGWASEGVDFAEEMIRQCAANARDADVSPQFSCASFFAADFPDESYDVVSAQGFIEYVSMEEIGVFMRRVHRMLRPGGALVLGSRNRLFNVFSLNNYTRQEMELGVLNVLISEAIALQSSPDREDALRQLQRLGRIDVQPDRHPVLGIPVETRYQFAPADLAYRLSGCGFETRALYPVHHQGLPPSLKAAHPALHGQIAAAVAEIGMQDHRLLPFASTFVIDARRRD